MKDQRGHRRKWLPSADVWEVEIQMCKEDGTGTQISLPGVSTVDTEVEQSTGMMQIMFTEPLQGAI